VHTAIFKPANELVGVLLQQAAERIDDAYAPKPGEQAKGREVLMVKGMFWGEPGANNVLAFRCIHASHRMDSCWKYRLNSRAAENVTLPLAA